MNDFLERLEMVGYGDFAEDNPRKTVELLGKHLFPKQLGDTMEERVHFASTLEEDVHKFMKVLLTEETASQ